MVMNFSGAGSGASGASGASGGIGGFSLGNVNPKMLMMYYLMDQMGQRISPNNPMGGIASQMIRAHQFSELLNKALGPDESKVELSSKGIKTQTPISEEMRTEMMQSMPSAKAAAATQLGVTTPDELKEALGVRPMRQAGTITDPFLISL
jgi:hypothetical protein